MPWFSAKLLFVARVGDHVPSDAVVEESIRVFRARDEDDAARRALEIGQNPPVEYKNSDGETVEWAFMKVMEVQDICEETLGDGTEVFSTLRRIQRTDYPDKLEG